MTLVVGIRFKDSGKTYYFAPHKLEDLLQGDLVIVDTVRGPELAKVAYPCRDVPDEEIMGEVRSILRRAERSDFERMAKLHARHEEVLRKCAEKVQNHQLPMNLVKAEYSFDGSRLTFYFTSEQRVDFRQLVRDLARTFRSRIELRQIGPRDEAKLLGGIGPCGRLLCCATFLPDYARVSIKMAKDQDLPLNPSKISGVCGRLLCCLSYEHQHYVDMKATMPAKDDWVQTPDGPGDVVGVNVLRAMVTVRLAGSGMEAEYSVQQIQQMSGGVHTLADSRTQEGITPVARSRRLGTRNEQPATYDEDTDAETLRLLDEDEFLEERGEPHEQETPPAPAGAKKRREQQKRQPGQEGEKPRARSAGKPGRSRAPQDSGKGTSGEQTEQGTQPDQPAKKSSQRSRKRSRPRKPGSEGERSTQQQQSSSPPQAPDNTSPRRKPRRRKRPPKPPDESSGG